MADVKIKTQNVNNPENVLIQIPKFISELWALKKGDKLDIVLSDDAKSLVVTRVDSDEEDAVSTT
jgi:hypothetical protein